MSNGLTQSIGLVQHGEVNNDNPGVILFILFRSTYGVVNISINLYNSEEIGFFWLIMW
jgi:hypothetical protein